MLSGVAGTAASASSPTEGVPTEAHAAGCSAVVALPGMTAASGGVARTQLDCSDCEPAAVTGCCDPADHADGVCRGLSLSSVARNPLPLLSAAIGAAQVDTGVLLSPIDTAQDHVLHSEWMSELLLPVCRMLAIPGKPCVSLTQVPVVEMATLCQAC